MCSRGLKGTEAKMKVSNKKKNERVEAFAIIRRNIRLRQQYIDEMIACLEYDRRREEVRRALMG